LLGSAFVFASSLSYALYLAGSGAMIQRLGSARFTALAMLISTLATQLHFLVTQPLSALRQPLPIYAYGAAMALLSTVLPVFLQSAAIRRIGASRSVMIGTLGPMLTIVFAWWLLDEPLSSGQMAGAVLVLAGVWLTSRRR
jgi:drug/metabolite transporter (DMT)-like permease